MNFSRAFMLICVASLLPGSVWAQPVDAPLLDPTEPPVVGQPDLFNGAVGRFEVSMWARPTKLRAGERLTLTVRVVAVGPMYRPPERPDLRVQRHFTERFMIEPIAAGIRELPGEHAWEFDYSLRPRDSSVQWVPNVRFDTFMPGFLPPELGYQTAYAYALPLTVLPPDVVSAAELPGGGLLEPLKSGLVRGTAVLETSQRLPADAVMAGLFLVPLIGSGLWAILGGRSSLSRGRSTKAGRAAQRMLADVAAGTPGAAAGVVIDYVRQRLFETSSTLTGPDVEAGLVEAGVDAMLSKHVADFLALADEARFAALPLRGDTDWRGPARTIIRQLEAARWRS